MMKEFLISKIAYATVTQTELYYQGSITIDEEILIAAKILPGQKVEILNLNNGARFETYVIRGEKKSGVICLNGPAARQAVVQDKIVILAYAYLTESEIPNLLINQVELDENNRIKTAVIRQPHIKP